ncbi:MAG: hypothetical protein MJZ13_04685 [Bacteroidales bacterium]|nr:hypothetical protein [Bacteroidales bacterium]
MRIKLLSCFTAMMLSAVCLNAQNYELVWSDEFDGTELNREVWNYETGTGTDGWGNWEKQYYTDRKDNVNVADGKLTITCKKEAYNGSQYTSGRIQTRNKVMFKYGKIESLIKVPMGASGVWPAFWMLGTGHGGAWPYCGEIDIMEMMCKADNATWNEALTTYHWNIQGVNGDYQHGSHGLGYKYGEELGAKWRVYGLEWTPTLMTGYVCDADGSNRHDICSLDISSHEGGMEAFTDYEFYIVYNFAFGGTYVNNEIDNSWTGDNMQVEWVRVYQDVDVPSSTNAIGNFTPQVNTDYIRVLSDKEFDGSVLDLSAAPFYIWEGTMKAHEADAFEGEGVIGLENCGETWYGAGYNYSASTINYDNLKNYTLHFALKTNMTEPFQVNCNKGNVQITPTKVNEWEEFNLPVATSFPGIVLGERSSFEPFTFNQVGGTKMSGRTFFIDDVYFYCTTPNTEPNIVVSGQKGKLKDKGAKATVKISGSNLASDVVITMSNANDFRLLTDKITPVEGKVNQDVEIEFIGTSSSATKLTFTCGELKSFATIVSDIRDVERLTTDYIILSRDEVVDGSFRDWTGETIDIWANEWTNGPTMSAAEGVTPFEGDNCLALKGLGKGWYGGAFVVNQKLDYEYINRYTFHLAYYASTTYPTTIKVFGAEIQLKADEANTWQEFEFPMWKYNLDLDVMSSATPLSFSQGAGEPVEAQDGKIIAFDDVYFYIPEGSGVPAVSCSSNVIIDTRSTTTGSIRISGSNLGVGAKLSLVSSNPNFELSTTSITAIGGKIQQDVTVTYKGGGIEYATVVATCGDIQKVISLSSFSDVAYSSSCNLVEGFTDGGRYYANTWNWVQLTGSTTTINGDGAEFYMPYATTTQFQSQFWLKPTSTLALEAGTKYSVKATLVSDKDATLTFKIVEHADNAPAFLEKKVNMRAGVATVINYTGIAIEGLNNESIFFDFGGNQAETKVTVYNVEVGLAECYGDNISVVEDTAIEVIEKQSNAKVYASGRLIFIENAEGDAQVYDMLGRCIYSGCESQISVNNGGIYIVKVDDIVKKIVIR